MSKLLKVLAIGLRVFILLTVIALLGVMIKGDKGVNSPLYYQTEKDTRVGGPFESTNSNGRYAIVEAIVDHGKVIFNEDEARFAAPDIAAYNGRYFSIFTPGVSFMSIPLYYVGKLYGIPQFTTYLLNVILALFNVGLIYILAKKLGANANAALIAGLSFLLGTNALAYALGLTQHHASVLFILLGLLNALSPRTLVNNFLFGVYFTAAMLMDVPNAFLMLPLMLYIVYRHFETATKDEMVVVRIKTAGIALAIGLIPLLAVFGWYNYATAGSYTTLAQMIGRSDYPAPQLVEHQVEVPVQEKTEWKRPVETPFETRLQLNGLYVLLFSNERAWWYYSPVVLFGIFGLILAYRSQKHRRLMLLATAVIGMNILLYSMLGDVWGGWSFGPRYLIPSAALLSIFVGLVVHQYRKNILVMAAFLIVLIYSLTISALGASTTSAIPPKVEATSLITPIPWTYQYNVNLITTNFSSSLFYNYFLRNVIPATQFLIGHVVVSTVLFTVLLALNAGAKKENNDA